MPTQSSVDDRRRFNQREQSKSRQIPTQSLDFGMNPEYGQMAVVDKTNPSTFPKI